MIALAILLWTLAAAIALVMLKNIALAAEGRVKSIPRGQGWLFSLGVVLGSGVCWGLATAGQALLR